MGIRVIVSGAGGKMGREVLRAVHAASDIELVGAVDPYFAGSDAGSLAGLGEWGVTVSSSLKAALDGADADCVVDFTAPDAVYDNVMTALEAGKRVVFGTTGLKDEELGEIDRAAKERGLGVVHAPNFRDRRGVDDAVCCRSGEIYGSRRDHRVASRPEKRCPVGDGDQDRGAHP